MTPRDSAAWPDDAEEEFDSPETIHIAHRRVGIVGP